MNENRTLPRFDPKRLPYERWWANTTVMLSGSKVSQQALGRKKLMSRYRIEIYVEYMDGDRMYRNQVDSWDTDLTTKEAALAAVPNYILLTQMKDPDPWNLKESKS